MQIILVLSSDSAQVNLVGWKKKLVKNYSIPHPPLLFSRFLLVTRGLHLSAEVIQVILYL